MHEDEDFIPPLGEMKKGLKTWLRIMKKLDFVSVIHNPKGVGHRISFNGAGRPHVKGWAPPKIYPSQLLLFPGRSINLIGLL